MDLNKEENKTIHEDILPIARKLFSQYPPTADLCTEDDKLLLQHVLSIRAKAYAVHEYPCIALFRFLDPVITRLWNYETEIIPRLNSTGTTRFLDVGCCFGQVLRRLVVDGAAPQNLIGTDLHTEFIQFGYELFRDGPDSSHPLASRFEAGDIFQDDFLADLNGNIDVIHVASMLHLFSWKDQLRVATRLDQLLKKETGAMIVGSQLGVEDAGELVPPGGKPPGIFRHNEKTFKEFWQSIGDGRWEVETRENKLQFDLDKTPMRLAQKGDSIIWLRFVVKRL